MAEERKGTPVEKWDEVSGRAGDGIIQDTVLDNEGRSLGERFASLRETTGMSRKDFAEYLNIPYRTMSDWETNKRTMPEYVFALIEYKVVHDLGLDSKTLGGQMRNIEDAVEQNDNSFDGIINNLPRPENAEHARESVLKKLRDCVKILEEERAKPQRVCCYEPERE